MSECDVTLTRDGYKNPEHIEYAPDFFSMTYYSLRQSVKYSDHQLGKQDHEKIWVP